MQETYGDIKRVLIIVIIASLISVCSIISMLVYSTIDRGTSVNEYLKLDEATVAFHYGEDNHQIILEFLCVTKDTPENYELCLRNMGGKTIEKIEIQVDYNFENTENCIITTKTDLSTIYYYDLKKK